MKKRGGGESFFIKMKVCFSSLQWRAAVARVASLSQRNLFLCLCPHAHCLSVNDTEMGLNYVKARCSVQKYTWFRVFLFVVVFQLFILYWSMMSLVAQWKTINLPMQEIWVWSLSWKEALEKELATCSSIPAWEILWTEPGGPQNPTSHISIRYYLMTKTTNSWWIMLC